MVRALTEKKKTENQSMAALTLRWSVGSANAPSTASAGSASSKARSDAPIDALTSSVTSTMDKGTARWRFCSWRRQRHTVHSTSGQTGHVNQASSFGRASRLVVGTSRQTQAFSAVPMRAARAQAASSQGTSLRESG